MSASQKASQELVGNGCPQYLLNPRTDAKRWARAQVSRMKAECITLRSKLKEVESDYHTLQTKHRYGVATVDYRSLTQANPRALCG
jgi:hypothetical protein